MRAFERSFVGPRRENAAGLRRWSARAVAFFAALVLVAGATFVAAPVSAKGRKAKASRTVSFEDDVVETAYLRPESSVVESINSRTRTSLIRIRMDFFKEIVRSATKL